MALEFSLAVEEWVNAAKRRQGAALQAVAWDVLNAVKLETPVDTGFLRANWTIVRGDDPMPIAGRVPDPAQVIATLRAGDKVHIVNPVIYAARVEFGFVGQDKLGRQYDQAGRGMVQKVAVRLPDIAAKAVARVIAGDPPITGGSA